MKQAFRLYCARCLLALSGLISALGIGGALYLQFFANEAPCPLCILQRYAYLLIGLFASVGAIMRGRRAVATAGALVLVTAASGIIFAARQLWLLNRPSFSCGFDALQPFVDRLPLARILPSIFKVSGICERSYPPIFGLSLPAWSLTAYLLIFLLTIISIRQRAYIR